ncbi:hypothetical protein CA834_13160 [Winogradskyella aurantia]|uniref:Uncharacterized protein n=2 Tax=Winogradskyella aurantia TaxID=1915063 RepID=A0A265UN77_9FLAO|nr:hypothetical protein CA834_13160 [Winogradskyella aurantia]
MLFMGGLAIGQTNSSPKKVPVPLAVFDDNVSAPLTLKERNYIIEAYGDYAEQYVFSKPQMLKSIKQLLRNRILIEKKSNFEKRNEATKLSEVPLFNNYVPELSRDELFDPRNFNPLKYQLEFYSLETKIYNVDGSDYVILIKSQHQ